MISLLGLDPATHTPHALHGDDRTYTETNCYADCLIEFVAAAGLEPEAMLAGAVASDFELDQWTFFKPTPGDLATVYGLDVHEVQPYRGFADLVATRLEAGQSVMPEVDSYWLPDVASTAYRTDHVKSSIIPEAIDLDAKVLRYFHNAGYFELAGEDFDGLFSPTLLPTYVELVRPGAVPAPADVRAAARDLLAHYLALRPAANPFAAFSASLSASLPALIEGPASDYHQYAFHNPRMVGASMELLASHVRWLCADDGQSEGERPPTSTTSSAAPRCCSSGSPASAPSTLPGSSSRWPRPTTPPSPSSTRSSADRLTHRPTGGAVSCGRFRGAGPTLTHRPTRAAVSCGRFRGAGLTLTHRPTRAAVTTRLAPCRDQPAPGGGTPSPHCPRRSPGWCGVGSRRSP